MNERVIAERTRRGLSVRAASAAGGISNTTWTRFEETGHLTGKVRQAVAKAFDWPLDWPEVHPEAGAFLRSWRSERADITLEQLATKLVNAGHPQVDAATLRRYESGVRPDHDLLQAIDDALRADGRVMLAFDLEPRQMREPGVISQLVDRVERLERAVARLLAEADEMPDADELLDAIGAEPDARPAST